MAEDLRDLALQSAAEIDGMADQFPKGEPARQWLRSLSTRLKNSYARTRGQQKAIILESISEGCRTIGDFVEHVGYSRREVVGLLADLKAAGYIYERTEKARSDGNGGRPGRWIELTEKGKSKISRAKPDGDRFIMSPYA